jgi:hypothetical protein
MINLSEQELQELKLRFGKVTLDESASYDKIIHTLKTGRIVKGIVTENGELVVNKVTNFLCE